MRLRVLVQQKLKNSFLSEKKIPLPANQPAASVRTRSATHLTVHTYHGHGTYYPKPPGTYPKPIATYIPKPPPPMYNTKPCGSYDIKPYDSKPPGSYDSKPPETKKSERKARAQLTPTKTDGVVITEVDMGDTSGLMVRATVVQIILDREKVVRNAEKKEAQLSNLNCLGERTHIIKVDVALIVTGRAPFTQGLGLKNIVKEFAKALKNAAVKNLQCHVFNLVVICGGPLVHIDNYYPSVASGVQAIVVPLSTLPLALYILLATVAIK
ncbi:hypothetical protein Tco_1025318 [Tanacetum coccineum]